MEKNEIESRIIEIINKKLVLDIDVARYRKYSMLDPRVGLLPRDLLVLFMEIQKEFCISFEEKDIINKRFDYIDNIVDSVIEKSRVSQ